MQNLETLTTPNVALLPCCPSTAILESVLHPSPAAGGASSNTSIPAPPPTPTPPITISGLSLLDPDPPLFSAPEDAASFHTCGTGKPGGGNEVGRPGPDAEVEWPAAVAEEEAWPAEEEAWPAEEDAEVKGGSGRGAGMSRISVPGGNSVVGVTYTVGGR